MLLIVFWRWRRVCASVFFLSASGQCVFTLSCIYTKFTDIVKHLQLRATRALGKKSHYRTTTTAYIFVIREACSKALAWWTTSLCRDRHRIMYIHTYLHLRIQLHSDEFTSPYIKPQLTLMDLKYQLCKWIFAHAAKPHDETELSAMLNSK